jgi:NDP-sugar pyrophosphorylase family protein
MTVRRGMILAAGLGTRLLDLSSERPKPLLPVADVPLVRWALALLRRHGVDEVVVNAHHLGDQLVAELGDEVTWSHEQPDILGTGGGVRRAAPLLGPDPFFVVNGKIVLAVDLDQVAALHARLGAAATLVVRRAAEAARWGAVDVDEAGARVRALRGAGSYMFTGVHLVGPEVVARLPPSGASDIVADAYLPLLAAGAPIAAYVTEGYFWEHSTPERYLVGNLNVVRGLAAAAAPPWPTSGVSPLAQVDPRATLIEPLLVSPEARIEAGATVGPDVVVGRGARVASGVHLVRVVVFSQAQATTSLEGAIVTGRQTLLVRAAPDAPTRP